MPVQRRTLGARVGEGLGAGLESIGNVLLQRAAQEQHDREQMDQKRTDKLLDIFKTFAPDIAANPSHAQILVPYARQAGLDLASPSVDALLAPVLDLVNKAKGETDLPASAVDAVRAQGLTTAPAFGVTSTNPATEDTLASTQYGPKQPKTVQDVEQLIAAKQGQFEKARQLAIKTKGEEAQTTAYGSTTGTNRANNENFPTKLGQEGQLGEQAANIDVTKQQRLNPILGQRAGLEEGARQAAQTTPTAIAGAASRAGAIKQKENEFTPATDSERQAASFYVRSVQGHNAALQIEGKGGVNYAWANSGLVPEKLRTELQKNYNTAQREFILAALRKETGAAISKQELEAFAQFFGQPGDTPATLLQKQAARMRIAEGLKPQAGRAIREYQQQGLTLPMLLKPGETLNNLLKQ